MPRKQKLIAKSEADCTKYIIKALGKAEAAGHRAHTVFEDWLQLVEATLNELPSHLKACINSEPHTDSPETAELWARMRLRYGDDDPERCRRYFDHFAEAFLWLIEATTFGYGDVIGDVYMQYAYPNPNAGQYFTPWDIALMMAQMVVGNGEAQIYKRIREAANKTSEENPFVWALLTASLVIQDADEALHFLITRLLPTVAPHFEPIKVSDPACGSGVMFLACASRFPTWAVQLGLVQFYGQDIDATCVRMARVNCMLYGLNGRYIEEILRMEEARFREVVPDAWQPIYEEAREADEAGDQEKVDEIAEFLRRSRSNPSGSQQTLFEPKPIYVVEPYFVEEVTECELIPC